MSADNWSPCPRCRSRRIDAAASALAEAVKKRDEAYGLVGMDVFHELMQEADEARENLHVAEREEGRETFREDYEIGLFDGELFIEYRGGCGVCDLEVKFQHTEAVS